MFRAILFLTILSSVTIFAHEESELDTSSHTVSQILTEQPDSIERIQEDKWYLKAERIFASKEGLFLFNNYSAVRLPSVFSDRNGCYITCKGKPSEYSWVYKCTNRKCRRVWDASEGSRCPACGSPGELQY